MISYNYIYHFDTYAEFQTLPLPQNGYSYFTTGSSYTIYRIDEAGIITEVVTGGTGTSTGTTLVQNGINTYTGGTYQFPTVNVSALTISSLSVSGLSTLRVVEVTTSLSANSLSANTYFSGTTPLESVIYNIANAIATGTGSTPTYLGNGLNTYTGGTASNPKVNVSGLTIDNIKSTGVSQFHGTFFGVTATTISLSGNSTRISAYGGDLNLVQDDAGDINITNPSANIFIQGAGNASLYGGSGLSLGSGDYMFIDAILGLFASGVTEASFGSSGNTHLFGINTYLDGILYSGTTLLETNIQNIAAQFSAITQVQPGLNTYTGGTYLLPTVNISSATLSNLSVSGNANFFSFSATSISGGTYFSGSTPLETIIRNISSVYSAGTGVHTWVQPGTNTYTGGTGLLPTVNISSATLSNLSTSGTNTAFSFSATSLSGGTYFSGSTPLSTIIYNIAAQFSAITQVQPGTNIYTGGTYLLPTVNMSSATMANLSVSGNANFFTFSATSISGGTYFSGSTPLETIIRNISSVYSAGTGVHTWIQPGTNTYTGGTGLLPTVNMSSATMANLSVSGNANFFSFSATSISGGTYFSGSTPLSTIINNVAAIYSAITYVQPGLNTYTGGTALFPAVNISSATLSNLSVSGNANFFSFSATSISGGTYFSGSTPLETIIRNISSVYSAGTGVHTWVQNGTNTYTGGTAALPSVNLSSATLSNLSVSGNANFFSFSATSLSAGTIYSGSTNLEIIFHNKNGYLLQKHGTLSGSTFTGNPKIAAVVFTTPFSSNSYAVTIGATVNRTWTVQSKAASGFTISANANPAFNSSDVFWIAGEIGEGYK